MAHSLLQEIYLKHAPEIYRFSFFKVRNKEEAEDITAETFTRLANTNIGEIQNVRAWLFKVCRNIIYDTYMRGAERNIQKVDSDMAVDVKDTDASVEDIVIESSLRQAIQESLQKIDQPVADIIVMKIWEGMHFNEIAMATESNINTVKAQYYRGIDKIKEITVQGNPRYKTYSFTGPIVAAGVFTMGQSSQFTISSAAVSAVGATAGILATSAATTAGVFSTGAVQALAALVATSAVALGGVAGVQYLSTQNEPQKTIDCIKTFESKDDLAFSFKYDSCKYTLSEGRRTIENNISNITITPKDKNLEYKITLTANNDVSNTENANVYCGDEFSILKDTNIARVRAYKFESTEEFIYYGTILKTEDITYPRTKSMQDIDGKNSKDPLRARLVGSSRQIMCVNSTGIVQSRSFTSSETLGNKFSAIYLSIEGKGISNLSSDLNIINDLAKTIELEDNEEEIDFSTWKDLNIELGQSAQSNIVLKGNVKAPADSVITKDIIIPNELPVDVRIRNSLFNLDLTYKLRSVEQTYVYDSLGEIESEYLGKLYRLTTNDLTHTYTSVINKDSDCELFSPKVKAPCGFGYILHPLEDDSFNGVTAVCKGEINVCDEVLKSLQLESVVSEKLVEKSFSLSFDAALSNTQKQVTIMAPEESEIITKLLDSGWPVAELIGSDFKMQFVLPYESFPMSFLGRPIVEVSDNLWTVEFSDAMLNSILFVNNLQYSDCGSAVFGEIKPPCSKAPVIDDLMISCTGGDVQKCAEVVKTMNVKSNLISLTKEYEVVVFSSVENISIKISINVPQTFEPKVKETLTNYKLIEIDGTTEISIAAHENFAKQLSDSQKQFTHSLYGKTYVHQIQHGDSPPNNVDTVYMFSNQVEEVNNCKSPFFREEILPPCGNQTFEDLTIICKGNMDTCINLVQAMTVIKEEL